MLKNYYNRKLARIKDYIQPADLKRINNADIVPWKIRLLCNVLFYSALRIGELHALQPKHVIKETLDQKDYYFIWLEDQKNKTKDEFTPLRIEEYSSIRDYIQANNIQPGNYVFGSPKFNFEKKFTTSWFNTELKKYCKLVGIDKKLSSHSFRKGRITQMRRENIPYEEIATVTRHKNINVLQTHYDKQIKEGAFDLINKPVN